MANIDNNNNNYNNNNYYYYYNACAFLCYIHIILPVPFCFASYYNFRVKDADLQTETVSPLRKELDALEALFGEYASWAQGGFQQIGTQKKDR